MSEAALNQAILKKWEAAGLDASVDTPDVPNTSAPEDTTVEASTETPETPSSEATPETSETPAQTAEQIPQAQQQEAEDELAAALGLGKPPADSKERAKWWKSRLAYSQVHKIVTEREKKLADTHATALKEHTDKISAFEQRLAEVQEVEQLIASDPVRFLTTMAGMYPDTYGRLFADQQEEDPNAGMPQPDYPLGDGKFTYSVEGLQKRDAWLAQQIKTQMMREFQPLIQRYEQDERQGQIEQIQQQNYQNVSSVVQEASTWPMFRENAQEILDVVKKLDPKMKDARLSLHTAYQQVVFKKLQANKDTVRAEVLKELKQQPRSTSSTAAIPVTKPEKSSEEDLDDRIKATWKQKGLI